MRNQTNAVRRAYSSKVGDAKIALKLARQREDNAKLFAAELGRAIAKHSPDYVTAPHLYVWGDTLCIGFNVNALGDVEPLVSALKCLQYWGSEPKVSEDVNHWGARRTYRFHNLEVEANMSGEAAQCRIVATGTTERTITETKYELRCG